MMFHMVYLQIICSTNIDKQFTITISSKGEEILFSLQLHNIFYSNCYGNIELNYVLTSF